jgi:2-dehydropantoate 2-reductase
MGERILIVGAGAVGAYVGGNLTRNGHEVILTDPWPEHVEEMRANGLRLEGQTEEECFTTPVKAMHLTELQGLTKDRLADIAFVSVKSYDTAWASALANEYLKPDGYAVSLQNSINEETLAAAVGWGRTLGCIASKIVVELVEPGFVRRSVAKGGEQHTVFRVGEPHGRITKRAERIAGMLADIDSSRATTNLWGERWSKLVANAMANGVSAATGLSNKQYTAEDVSRRLSIRLAGEAVRVGLADGYALETINGFAPEMWVAAADELNAGANDAPNLNEVEDKMLASLSRMSDTARPSMGQDMAKGRRTEIVHINGMVARRAEQLGMAAPANAGLVTAVQSVERGEAKAGLDRVRDL